MKNENFAFRIIYISIIIIFLSNCSSYNNNGPEIKRFEQDLFSIEVSNPKSINKLKAKYPEFFPVFCTDIIGIGPVEDSLTGESLGQFIYDPVIKRVYQMTDSIYNDLEKISDRVRTGLNRFNKMIDGSDSVQLISYISGFNQSFVTLPGILGMGLDNYLGADTEYYTQLAIPKYISKTMIPENLAIDAVRAWIMSELIQTPEIITLLDHIIYEGKILYLLQESLPKEKEHNILKYSPEQLQWCNQYEKSMWGYIIENNLLYSPDRILISRITKEAPFVREFGQESPGRAGSWLGLKIVKAYMKKTRSTPMELISLKDSRSILANSRYRPG